jgi:hypothetical protein
MTATEHDVRSIKMLPGVADATLTHARQESVWGQDVDGAALCVRRTRVLVQREGERAKASD